MADRPFYGLIPKVVDSHMVQEDAKRKRILSWKLNLLVAFLTQKSLNRRLGVQNHSRNSDEHNSNLPAWRLARLPPSLIVRRRSLRLWLGSQIFLDSRKIADALLEAENGT